MEIKFQNKEESNKQQQDDFLKLSKAERVYAFFRLMERVSKFPVKNKIESNKDNFIIELKAKTFLVILLISANFIYSQNYLMNINFDDYKKYKKVLIIEEDYEFNSSILKENFVLYQNGKDEWKAINYIYKVKPDSLVSEKIKNEFQDAINKSQNTDRFEKEFIEEKIYSITSMDFDLLWLKILQTKVEKIPNKSDIDYKLIDYKIVEEDGKKNLVHLIKGVDHGVNVKIYYKNDNIYNVIEYPHFYFELENHKDVDELQYIYELLKIVHSEFNIDP
jgi:hypothetical protein